MRIKLVGFWNRKKKNENEPDIRLYESKPQGEELGESIASLWENTSNAGNKYFSGVFNDETHQKRGYITGEPETTEGDGGGDSIPF